MSKGRKVYNMGKVQNTKIEISESEYKRCYLQLEQKVKKSEQELLNLLEEKKSTISNEREVSSPAVHSLLYTISMKAKEMEEAKRALNNFSKLYVVNSSIGTHEYAEIGDLITVSGDCNASFNLVVEREEDDMYDAASCESPLGIAVLGHKIGDNCSYSVDDRKFNICICDILKSKDIVYNDEQPLSRTKE